MVTPAAVLPEVTDSAQAEWLQLLNSAISTASAAADDDPLARALGGYRCLVEAWEHALQTGQSDAGHCALATLARHAQSECLNHIRAWLSAGPAWDAVVRLPLPAVDFLALLPPMPGRTVVVALWGALVDYQREVDAFCGLYQSIGSSTLERLEAAVAASSGPSIDTVAALYALWQACQDSCEAEIVRRDDYADRLGAVTAAAAALRLAYRRWFEHVVPNEASQPRAVSDEIAVLRRHLRAMADRPDGSH